MWLLFPTPYAVSATILLHVIIAAAGAYLAGRRTLALGRPAALFGAALFALGGYLTAQGEHVNQLQGLAWLPWLFVVVERLKTKGTTDYTDYTDFSSLQSAESAQSADNSFCSGLNGRGGQGLIVPQPVLPRKATQGGQGALGVEAAAVVLARSRWQRRQDAEIGLHRLELLGRVVEGTGPGFTHLVDCEGYFCSVGQVVRGG